jgi:hypothetical protein
VTSSSSASTSAISESHFLQIDYCLKQAGGNLLFEKSFPMLYTRCMWIVEFVAR